MPPPPSTGNEMTLIDTNVILRYILNDIPDQADKAEKIINAGAGTLPEVIAEVVYVLTKLYCVPRERIAEIMCPLFDEVAIQVKEVMVMALEIFSKTALDFVDCILISRNKVLSEQVFSFDKRLTKQLNLSD